MIIYRGSDGGGGGGEPCTAADLCGVNSEQGLRSFYGIDAAPRAPAAGR